MQGDQRLARLRRRPAAARSSVGAPTIAAPIAAVARRCAPVGSKGTLAASRSVSSPSARCSTPRWSPSTRCLRKATPSSSVKSSSNFSRSTAARRAARRQGSGYRAAPGRRTPGPPPPRSRRQGFGDRRQVLQRPVDQLADGPGGDALRCWVHRRDPPRVHELPPRRRGGPRPPGSRAAAGPCTRCRRPRPPPPPSRYMAAVHGWLKNVRSRYPVPSHSVTVTMLCLRRVSRLVDLLDVRDHRDLRPSCEAADGGHARAVDVPAGVVVQQLGDGLDAELLRQDRCGLGPLGPGAERRPARRGSICCTGESSVSGTGSSLASGARRIPSVLPCLDDASTLSPRDRRV